MSITLKTVIYWGVGAVALIALAGAAPDMATILAVILIVGVLLTHYQDYSAIVNSFSPQGNKGGF